MLKTLTPEEFQTFATTVKQKSFEQSAAMGQVFTQRGYRVDYLGYETDGQLTVAALIYSTPILGGLHSEIYYGPIYTNLDHIPAFLEELKSFAKSIKALEITVKPYDIYQTFTSDGQSNSATNDQLIATYQTAGFEHLGLTQGFETSDWHYVKDLTDLTKDSLLKTFTKQGKSLVKKAGTFGTKIRLLKREELQLFKELTEATSERRSYNDKPLSYYEFLYDSFGKQVQFLIATLNFTDYLENLTLQQDQLKQRIHKLQEDLLTHPNSNKKHNQLRELLSQSETFDKRRSEAKELIKTYGSEDQVLAGAIFIFTPQEAVYFLSGSYPEFNRFYAPGLLQEYVMHEAIDQGITSYNLRGISGLFDGSDSILKFKQNFNGHIERRPGAFSYYPHPLKYKMISFLKKITGRQ